MIKNNSNYAGIPIPRILIIDDDVEIVELLVNILESKNYQVIAEYNGISGQERAEKENPDIILLDVNLPDRDGREICKTLKEDRVTRYIPIIMMTAKTDMKTKQGCFDSGANEFINKPFDVVELQARIISLLHSKTLQDELLESNRNLSYRIDEKAKSLKQTYMQTVMSLIKTIEAKDKYTRSHSTKVAKFSYMIARKLKLEEVKTKALFEAAELHDLGKIAIPDSILSKPGKLTPEEYECVKKHSLVGAEILKPLSFLNGSIETIAQHHERFDGNGYPYRTKGEAIPLGARIIAVADSFEAMTSDRPYRKALSDKEAMLELEVNSGKQFDFAVVLAFLSILNERQ